MGKLKLNHYLGLMVVAYFLFVIVLILLASYFSNGITPQILTLSGVLFLLILFYVSDLFADILIENKESSLKEDDKELLKLRMEDAKLHMSLAFGGGLTLLVTGMMADQRNYLMVSAGLILLTLSNFLYNRNYMPRILQLDRWRVAEIDVKKTKINK